MDTIENSQKYPLVTVIIPVYNREATILRSINSVLRQTYKNIEVIVVDDHSTDSTADIVKKCDDARVRVICLPHNCGANFARNRGIEKARGEFIAFQDSDDEWMEDKLEDQIKYMLDEEVKASFSPYILCDGEQRRVIPKDFQNVDLYTTQLREKLKEGNVVGTPTLIVQKHIFSKIGMFNENMNRLQDYEFVIRLVKRFRLGYIGKPLVRAYKSENSISADEKALLDAYKILIKEHFNFIDHKGVIDCIFKYTSVFKEEEINWQELDKFADIIGVSQGLEKEKTWNNLIIEYIYKKYVPIKKMLNEWYCFFCDYIKGNKFAIYGAGTYGKKAYDDLRREGYIPKFFLVTKYGKERELQGIPIMELKDDIDKNIPIVIAVSWEKQKELIQNLQNLNIYRFCIYPYC